MSRLKPLVRERFKSKISRYDAVQIMSDRDHLYVIKGIRKEGHIEYIETISERLPLKIAREAMWVYAEVQDGLPVLAR